ncbi:MAG: hypothetical protein AB1491_06485 [Thermodesulfobacteriota bacterium]
MTRCRWWLSLTLIMFLAVVFCGCAGMQTSQTQSTEDLLSAAGFKLRIPDTPKKMAHLQSLTQRQIFAFPRNGKIYYVYADAVNNRLYIGNEAAYQRYQQMAIAQKIAQQQYMAAQMSEAAAMDWDMWGPWDPYW